MAEPNPIDDTIADETEVLTKEENMKQGNELYENGMKHYYMKEYALAADELSEACTVLSSVYGDRAPQLGQPYLGYAKALIALAQEEQCLMETTDTVTGNADDSDDDDDDDEAEEEKENEDENEAEAKEVSGEANAKDESVKSANSENGGGEKKIDADVLDAEPSISVEEESSSADQVAESAAVPSTSTGVTGTEADTETVPEIEIAANLQVAWEILEVAVPIFIDQGEEGKQYLAEAYNELAQISIENNHPDVALGDLGRALEIHMNLDIDNRRIIAEIHYKIGMCRLMENCYDEAMVSYKKAIELLRQEIDEQREKAEAKDGNRNPKSVEELEKLCDDLEEKVTEIEEAKQGQTEKIREALAELTSSESSADGSGAGPSSRSSRTDDSKPPTDISHLIKRKKSAADGDEPAAKRPQLE